MPTHAKKRIGFGGGSQAMDGQSQVHSVEIAEILSPQCGNLLSLIFDKNFVKLTFLLKKLPKN